jgi:putative transposase
MYQNGNFYHVFNRGVDKRDVFMDEFDFSRFIRCVDVFNDIDPVYSLYWHDYLENKNDGKNQKEPLVEIIAYCLLPNHFHLLLRQSVEGGISELIKRVVGGYTKYVNYKYKRSGVIFGSKTKHRHLESSEVINKVSAYINGNSEIHGRCECVKWPWSSANYYLRGESKIYINKKDVMQYFDCTKEYRQFLEKVIINSKNWKKETKRLLMEGF